MQCCRHISGSYAILLHRLLVFAKAMVAAGGRWKAIASSSSSGRFSNGDMFIVVLRGECNRADIS